MVPEKKSDFFYKIGVCVSTYIILLSLLPELTAWIVV